MSNKKQYINLEWNIPVSDCSRTFETILNESAFKTNAVQNWAVSRTDVLIIVFMPDKCNL